MALRKVASSTSLYSEPLVYSRYLFMLISSSRNYKLESKMCRLSRRKILPHFIVFASLMWSIRMESEKGKLVRIDASMWNGFAGLVNRDNSRIFKHQEVGNILIENYTYSIDDGFGIDDDNQLSTVRNWASCNMSSTGKNLEVVLFPKLWLSSSISTLENISLAVELENAYQIFRECYLRP